MTSPISSTLTQKVLIVDLFEASELGHDLGFRHHRVNPIWPSLHKDVALSCLMDAQLPVEIQHLCVYVCVSLSLSLSVCVSVSDVCSATPQDEAPVYVCVCVCAGVYVCMCV